MKIAYFLPYTDNNGIGGAANTLLQQAALAYTYLHYEVHVYISIDESGKYKQEYERRCMQRNLKYSFLRFGISENDKGINLTEAARDIPDVIQTLENENFDIFHSVQLNITVEYASRFLGVPHVMNIYQEFNCLNRAYDIFPRYVSSDAMHYLTRWEKWLDADNAFCIRCYTDINQQHEFKNIIWNENNVLDITIVGHVSEIKNQLSAIKAIQLLSKNGKNVHLTLVGDDTTNYAEICREYVQDNNISHLVEFAGFQSNVAQILSNTDVFLSASTWESFPSSIVEAMAMGVPIVSTPAGGISEILEDGVNAYLIDGFDEYAIYSKLDQFITDCTTMKINEISKNSRETFEKFFSKAAVGKSLQKLYADMSSAAISNNMEDFHLLFREKNGTKESGAEIVSCSNDSYSYFAKTFTELYDVKKVILWGAGKYGADCKKMLENSGKKIQIVAYVDENKTGTYEGVQVIKKQDLYIYPGIFIIISCNLGKERAKAYLESLDKQQGKDFIYFA